MAQQEILHGRPSELTHPPREDDASSQTARRPSPFVPFLQQQGFSVPPQAEPSLSLSLERPDSYADADRQRPNEGPFCPTRPSDVHCPSSQSETVRPFDLEQTPYQHTDHITAPSPRASHAEALESTVYAETYQNREMEHAENAANSTVGASSQRASDGLQLVPASEFPSRNEDGHHQYYPPPLANHEDVVRDAELFISTLDKFLVALGTKLTIPNFGGKEMNLHLFYSQVTACGGLEQVIRAGQWKELSEVLDVPKHVPNASFVLRRLYSCLLFDYEQVYYFGVEGKLRLPPVPLPSPKPFQKKVDDASCYEIPPELKASFKKRKRKLDPLQVFGVDPAGSVGSFATGAINGKFEQGYLVTVVVGTEKLSGMLYHVSDNMAQQYASVPSLVDSIGADGSAPGMEIQLYGCNKKREYVRKFDPNAPKRTRTAYNIYFKEQRAKLKELYPGTKGHGKQVIEMWNQLSDQEKAPYVAQVSQEREKNLAEHKEKMRLQQAQAAEETIETGIVPTGEEHDHVTYDTSHDYHVSLDVDNDPHSGHAHISEVDYQVYHVNDSQEHISESELTGSHILSEQAYEDQANEGDYSQQPASDEEEDNDGADLEEGYEEDEDEQAYPGSEMIQEGQNGDEYDISKHKPDGNDYLVSEKHSGMHDDAYHPQTDEVEAQELEVPRSTATSKVQFYGHDHPYNYVSTMPHQRVEGAHGSTNIAPFEQMPYSMQENGQIFYPHAQQGHAASGDSLGPPQQYFNHSGYVFPQGRQGRVAEALGLPVPQDQGSFRVPDEAAPYMPPFQQSQAGMHAQQVPSEVAYRDRYAYPLSMPYPQMYTRSPHPYALRFPHPPYPMQMNEGTALQYGHSYAAQVHQPQASIGKVSGVAMPSAGYHDQDGGHAMRFQDGSLTPAFKHGAQK